jgi:hypothetical protein
MADNNGEMIPLPNIEVRGRLMEFRQRHQDLDAAVEALAAMPTPDQLQIARLKKQKLISLMAHNVTRTNNIHPNDEKLKKYYRKVIKSYILKKPFPNIAKKASKKRVQ